MAELKATLKHNIIGRPQNQRDTIKVLGLTKISSSVVRPSNRATGGMISTVSHLADVGEI